MRDNQFIQWIVQGLSVIAFIILAKLGVSYLPSAGPLGAVKTVISGI